MLYFSAGTGALKGDIAKVSFRIKIQDRVFVQIPGLNYFLSSKLDVQSICIFEILYFHGLYPRSKNALCTIPP